MNKKSALEIFDGINTRNKKQLRKRYDELREKLSKQLEDTEIIQHRIKITNKIGDLDDAYMLLSGKKNRYKKKEYPVKKTPAIIMILSFFVLIQILSNFGNYFTRHKNDNSRDFQFNMLDSTRADIDLVEMEKQRNDFTDSTIGLNFEMVYIRDYDSGLKNMGKNAVGDKYAKHQINQKQLYFGKYEVTQKQWEILMGYNPSRFKGCDQCPVENVSWHEVKQFIVKLNDLSGKNYRLPAEAEWAFVDPDKNRINLFNGRPDLERSLFNEFAWNSENSDNRTHKVGEKRPIGIGIYDMKGNVWEWCEDDWNENGLVLPDNGQAWVNSPRSDQRVARGGSWSDPIKFQNEYYRRNFDASKKYNNVGFRLAMDEE